MRKSMRAAVVVALTMASVTAVDAASHANLSGARVTVADRPGAPGEVLHLLEAQTGRPVGTLTRVLAVDTGGQSLTADQYAALVAGRDVEGVRVLGAMPGSPELLGTTLADLSDGSYDGPRDGGASDATVVFASDVPEYREWCLTMCMASLKSLQECIMERYSSAGW
jgi:hypothetical protein